MSDRNAKFVKILRAELEDLLEDIAFAERKHAERFARSEITDYVYRENDALFRLEAESLRMLIGKIDLMDVSGYTTTAELASAMDELVLSSLGDREEPGAVHSLFTRKLNKVRSYVDSGDCP